MTTIFYSWQSDLPSKINRGFIRDVLDIAVRELSKDLLLNEAPRLDQDTAGIPGSPDIVSSILMKIESCSMFVADLTLVGSQGTAPNPNVLIEYGYALKSKGPERIIGVMNVAFGLPESLPFDLKARRWPIQYNLIEDTSRDMRRQQKRLLIDHIREALETAMKEGLFPEVRSVYEDRGMLVI